MNSEQRPINGCGGRRREGGEKLPVRWGSPCVRFLVDRQGQGPDSIGKITSQEISQDFCSKVYCKEIKKSVIQTYLLFKFPPQLNRFFCWFFRLTLFRTESGPESVHVSTVQGEQASPYLERASSSITSLFKCIKECSTDCPAACLTMGERVPLVECCMAL